MTEHEREVIRLLQKLAGEEECKLCEDRKGKISVNGGFGYIDKYGKEHNHQQQHIVRLIQGNMGGCI